MIGWARARVPAIIGRNFRLKAMAVMFALVVWSVVVYASNPPDSRAFTVPVHFDALGTKWVLDGPMDPLPLRITGTRDHVAAFDPARVRASVDVSRIAHEGDQDVSVIVTNGDGDVSLDPAPATVRARVDVASARQVPVTPVIVKPPPPGFRPEAPVVTPGAVLITGPAKVIAQITAEVDPDLSGFKTNYQAQLPVRLRDPSLAVVTDLGATPSTVLVEVVINSSLTSRAVPVVLTTQGLVAAGHLLGSITPDPQTVVLSGPQTVLNQIDFLTLQVTISGLFGSVTLSNLPINTGVPGVTATPARIDVHVLVLVAPPPPTPPPTLAPSPAPTPTPIPPPTP